MAALAIATWILGSSLQVQLFAALTAAIFLQYPTDLLDPENLIWGQSDSFPIRRETPRSSWTEGEIITDW
jgi:hypothetical protein